jgi:hypothetical protein
MSTALRKELERDATDIYNTRVKFVIVPFFAIYSIAALFGRSSSVQHNNETDAQADHAILSGVSTHISRDSGLRMQLLVDELPVFLHRGHSIAAVLLCFTMVYQKQTVLTMYKSLRLGGQASGSSYSNHLFWHRWVGRLGLVLVVVMDLCGLFMGPLSSWPSFETFNYFFFAPWVFMIIGIYGCASSKLLCYHRFFGNMLLKGCIATPLARLAGAALQKQVLLRFDILVWHGLNSLQSSCSSTSPELLQLFLGLGGFKRILRRYRDSHGGDQPLAACRCSCLVVCDQSRHFARGEGRCRRRRREERRVRHCIVLPLQGAHRGLAASQGVLSEGSYF